MEKNNSKAYWKENIKYLFILLTVWFLVSFGAGILFKDLLNEFKFGGFKLGFWFAQQGSIYVFVTLIFIYIGLMNKLDKKYHSKKLEYQKKTGIFIKLPRVLALREFLFGLKCTEMKVLVQKLS